MKRNKSNTYSKKPLRLVTMKTELIANNPFQYKPIDFKDIRVASMGNFCIYFKVNPEKIIVSAFWDNR